jgi:hypothetical protein
MLSDQLFLLLGLQGFNCVQTEDLPLLSFQQNIPP